MKNILSNKAYDILKWIALIVVPVIGEAYGRLATIWGLPYASQVQETALVVTFVIGALIGISTIKYNKTLDIVEANIKDFKE